MNVAAPSWAAGFSPLAFNAVPPWQVQDFLRQMYAQWGLPVGHRWDNGLPWGPGAGNDLPSPLALWLAGLGLVLTFNPPRQPRYNGVVEKSHETHARWSGPYTASSAAVWQERVEAMDRRQRQAYPYLGKRSRMAVFAELAHSGREYSAGWERANWDVQRARQYLASHVAQRRVNAQGTLSLYGHNRYVGTRHRHQSVLVHYDPCDAEWFVTQPGGGQLRRLAAPEISAERILALDVSAK